MANENFIREFNEKRKKYLVEKLTKHLRDLDIKELEDINFIIMKRKYSVGFDNMGREFCSQQPGQNSQVIVNNSGISNQLNMVLR